jgi:YggT family protein
VLIVANLLNAVALVLDSVLKIYSWIVIARAVLSWVNPDPYNPIVRFLYAVTEPVLYRVRRVVPVLGGSVDVSPIVVLLGIFFLQAFLVQSLRDLAFALR